MDPSQSSDSRPVGSSNPALCVANCGFYGSASFQGLCSVCHKAGKGGVGSRSGNNEGAEKDSVGNAASEPKETLRPTISTTMPAITLPIEMTNAASSQYGLHPSPGSSPVFIGMEFMAPNDSPRRSPSSRMLPPPPTLSLPSLSISPPRSNPNREKLDVDESNKISEAITLAGGEIPSHLIGQKAELDLGVLGPLLAPLDEEPIEPVVDAKKQVPGKCFKCEKKVGLLGFKCRCDFTYCGMHRHADSHSCTFDFRAMKQTELAAQNKKVVAAKITKF